MDKTVEKQFRAQATEKKKKFKKWMKHLEM